MQLYSSETLETWLRRSGRVVRSSENIALFRQMLEAIAYIHSKGLVHRFGLSVNHSVRRG